MPRTLSGLQTGEFDEVDILHSIQINSNPGGANQVLTSDGVNSNWNDIPSQLPAGTSKQILTVDTNNAPIFTDRSALVTGNLLVDGDGKLQLSSQPIVNDLRATDYIGGSDANNKASLNYISNLQCDTINGVAPSELPSGTVNQILTVGADGSAVFSDRNDLVSGNIEIDSNNNKITLKATPTVLSLLATENIGGPSPTSKAGLVNISDINCQTINTQTPTISGVALGGFLPSLTISRSGGNRTYNGTGAINVPEPSRLIIAHKGTDLITYDSSLDTNQSVNIDTKTLTINVGNSTIHTYDTTVDKSVDIDFYTSGTNIGITDGVGNNRAVNLSIEETLVTSGNDINMANATYGGTSGDIVNVKSILMDANAGEIGSTSNLVNNIHAARIYVAQIGAVGAYNDNIYSDHVFATALYPTFVHGITWTDSNKSSTPGTGGTRIDNLPTSQPIGSNTAGLLWNDNGTLKVSS